MVERAGRDRVGTGHELLESADDCRSDRVPAMIGEEKPKGLRWCEDDVTALGHDRAGTKEIAEVASVPDQVHHDTDAESRLVPPRASDDAIEFHGKSLPINELYHPTPTRRRFADVGHLNDRSRCAVRAR